MVGLSRILEVDGLSEILSVWYSSLGGGLISIFHLEKGELPMTERNSRIK